MIPAIPKMTTGIHFESDPEEPSSFELFTTVTGLTGNMDACPKTCSGRLPFMYPTMA
jgi:hypothetical protein